MLADTRAPLVKRNAEFEVRELESEEWRTLRGVRLSALLDAPDAFIATLEEETRLSDREWRARFDGARWIVAAENDRIIGLAALVGTAPLALPPHIESMWVAPSHRLRGVLHLMVDFLVETGRSAFVDCLLLWVLGDNVDARAAYARLGFYETGEVQQLESDPARAERRLRLDVSRPVPTKA